MQRYRKAQYEKNRRDLNEIEEEEKAKAEEKAKKRWKRARLVTAAVTKGGRRGRQEGGLATSAGLAASPDLNSSCGDGGGTGVNSPANVTDSGLSSTRSFITPARIGLPEYSRYLPGLSAQEQLRQSYPVITGSPWHKEHVSVLEKFIGGYPFVLTLNYACVNGTDVSIPRHVLLLHCRQLPRLRAFLSTHLRLRLDAGGRLLRGRRPRKADVATG